MLPVDLEVSCRYLRSIPLQVVKKFTYTGEGWGMLGREKSYHSDGTSTLRFRDPATFQETGTSWLAMAAKHRPTQ